MNKQQQTSLAWAERPLAELLRLAWPMVVQLLSLSMMSFVDTLFIGWIGWIELAAAGLGGMSTFTVLSFGMALFSAAKVEVGSQHGRQDTSAVERSLGAFLRLALILGVFSLIAGLIAAALLTHLAADRHTGELAAEYAAIRSSAFVFVLFGNAIGQWLAAQGDAQSAMRAALIANFANIPLNAALIFGLGWGVQGAAIASAISAIIEVLYLVRLQASRSIPLESGGSTSAGFHWDKARWRDSWDAFTRGLPTGIERVLDMMAFAAIPVLLSQAGSIHVAAHQVVLQILLIAFLPSIALSDSLSVLVAQAVGANQRSVLRRISGLALVVGIAYALLCALLYLGWGELLISIFSHDKSLIEVALPALGFGALLQGLNAIYNHYKGMLRGLSVFRYVAWVAVGCAWLATPPLTYLWGVTKDYGVKGAWMALCTEVAIGVLFVFFRARRHPALARRLPNEDESASPSWA